MPEKAEWKKCKLMTRSELKASGGCLWSVRSNSPGNNLAIPSGTNFRIRYEGPESHVYVSGVCEGTVFRITSSKGFGSYSSASAAVNAVRSHVEKTNAYLYIEFQVGNDWHLADNLRYNEDMSVPVNREELKALEEAFGSYGQKFRIDKDHDLNDAIAAYTQNLAMKQGKEYDKSMDQKVYDYLKETEIYRAALALEKAKKE